MNDENQNLPANRTSGNIDTKTPIRAGENGLQVNNLADMWRFAQYVAQSGMCPKNLSCKPETILVAMEAGMEVGFKPLQAIQQITVINGKPNIYGDAGMALIRSRDLLEDYQEKEEGKIEDGTKKWTVIMKRKGMSPISRSFSIAEAKRAGLWEKPIWKQYPDRLLRYRALSFAMRDNFSDVLMGLSIVEEDHIETKERNITAEVQVSDPRALALTETTEPAPEPQTDIPPGGPEAACNEQSPDQTITHLTPPPFDRNACIKELEKLIDKAKAKKVASAMEAAGVNEWNDGGDYRQASDEKLKSVLSFLKC